MEITIEELHAGHFDPEASDVYNIKKHKEIIEKFNDGKIAIYFKKENAKTFNMIFGLFFPNFEIKLDQLTGGSKLNSWKLFMYNNSGKPAFCDSIKKLEEIGKSFVNVSVLDFSVVGALIGCEIENSKKYKVGSNSKICEISIFDTLKQITSAFASFPRLPNGKCSKPINVNSSGDSSRKHVIHPEFEEKNVNRYNSYSIETIEMMRRIWGDDAVRQWAEMTAFKYRMRMGHKDEIKKELVKENNYLNYARHGKF